MLITKMIREKLIFVLLLVSFGLVNAQNQIQSDKYYNLLKEKELEYLLLLHLPTADSLVKKTQDIRNLVQNAQKELDKSMLYISYYTKGNSIYIFTIHHLFFDFKEIKINDAFARNVTDLYQGIIKKNDRLFIKASNQISPILLPKKIASNITHLIISPDSLLSSIPFETLFTKKSNRKSMHKQPYWIKKYTIAYQYSLTSLAEGLQQQRKEDTILIKQKQEWNTPVFDQDLKLKDYLNSIFKSALPATKEEVKKANKIFSKKETKRRKKLLERTESLVKKYKYITFSPEIEDTTKIKYKQAIILTSSEDTLKSTLKVPSDTSKTEIYPLNLSMLFLSLYSMTDTVQTPRRDNRMRMAGFGLLKKIMPLWDITSDMPFFSTLYYKHESSQHVPKKSKAMQLAKLEMIKNTPQPYYWCPFILIGVY